MLPKKNALPLLAVAAAAAIIPANAPAKGLTDATYTVVARATMDESWTYDQNETDLCLDGCSVETKGSGSAHLSVKSRPTTWMVLRGAGGRPPMIDVGTGEGALAVGEYRRDGSLTTTHAGAWAAANPPEAGDTTGCGTKNIKIPFHLSFTGRTTLAPQIDADLDPANCPDGPSTGLTWPDETPSLSAVTTTASPTRFLSVHQFTVKGTKSFHTAADPADGPSQTRSGEKTVRWSWSVTFTMNNTKHKHRR